MTRSIAKTAAVAAFAGLVVTAVTAKAEDLKVSGTSYLSQVESHMIPVGGDATHVFLVEKWVGANSSPGWFGTMQFTAVGSGQADLKKGTGEDKSAIFWSNEEGNLSGSYVGKSSFTVDDKTNVSKGTYEGIWELTSGTGRYSDVRGHGTVKGEFVGGNAIDHWNGTVTGSEKRASTQ